MNCLLCSEEAPRQDRDRWLHYHLLQCEKIESQVAALNGVHLGDHWQNRYTRTISRVSEINMIGLGTYAGHEAAVALWEVWSPPSDEEGTQLSLGAVLDPPSLSELVLMEPCGWEGAHPLWSLSEHWEPLTRPGQYPTPIVDPPGTDSRGSCRVPSSWWGPGLRGNVGGREAAYYACWREFSEDGRYAREYPWVTS